MTTYNDIKEHLNIKIDKHLNDGFAHLTHYWQNHKNGISRTISARYYKDGSEIFDLGVPLRVGLSVPIFLSFRTKRISTSIPNAIQKAA
ncbi:MAG: hypothetical protein ACK4M4_11000 [Flavobacterium sp.]